MNLVNMIQEIFEILDENDIEYIVYDKSNYTVWPSWSPFGIELKYYTEENLDNALNMIRNSGFVNTADFEDGSIIIFFK